MACAFPRLSIFLSTSLWKFRVKREWLIGIQIVPLFLNYCPRISRPQVLSFRMSQTKAIFHGLDMNECRTSCLPIDAGFIELKSLFHCLVQPFLFDGTYENYQARNRQIKSFANLKQMVAF